MKTVKISTADSPGQSISAQTVREVQITIEIDLSNSRKRAKNKYYFWNQNKRVVQHIK